MKRDRRSQVVQSRRNLPSRTNPRARAVQMTYVQVPLTIKSNNTDSIVYCNICESSNQPESSLKKQDLGYIQVVQNFFCFLRSRKRPPTVKIIPCAYCTNVHIHPMSVYQGYYPIRPTMAYFYTSTNLYSPIIVLFLLFTNEIFFGNIPFSDSNKGKQFICYHSFITIVLICI